MTSGSSKKDSERKSKVKAKAGVSSAGGEFYPGRSADAADAGKAAPAPGLPVSQKEYDRLKRAAKSASVPRSKHRQEDPSGER